MLWFKHISRSTSDNDLATAISRYGSDGYFVFFNCLEILAREDAVDSPLETDWKTFCTWFPSIRKRKVLEIVNYFCEKNRFKSKLNGNSFSLFCPKLCDISSDYTKKVRKKSEECPDNVQNKKIEGEGEGEERRKKKEKRRRVPRFTPPKIEEVREYCQERKNTVDPESWYSHYMSNGWKVGKNQMKDWKSAVITWEKNNFNKTGGTHAGTKPEYQKQADGKYDHL